MKKGLFAFFILSVVCIFSIDQLWCEEFQYLTPKRYHEGPDFGESAGKLTKTVRVMFIIPEFHISRKIPDPAGETEMIKRFIKSGFKVIDKTQSDKLRNDDQLIAHLKGDRMLAARIGKQHGADLLVVGEAFSETAGEMFNGMISCRARIEAQVIRTDTAEIIASDGVHGSGLDIAESISGKTAIQKAATNLAEKLTMEIINKYNTESSKGTALELVISGLDYDKMINLVQTIEKTSKCAQSAQMRSFVEGRGLVDVDITCSPDQFVQELSSGKMKPFSFKVTSASPLKLEMTARYR